MGLYSTNIEERVRDVELTNPTINRLTHYFNILSEEIEFLQDNGIKDFFLLNSSNKIQMIKPFHNKTSL